MVTFTDGWFTGAEFNIIPLAFMHGIATPATNFANAGDNCTVFAGTQLLDCPQIEYVDTQQQSIPQ
jgi:hypothetical protein